MNQSQKRTPKLQIRSQVSSLDYMNEELKIFILKKLEECIYNKIVNIHDPWYEKLETNENQEKNK